MDLIFKFIFRLKFKEKNLLFGKFKNMNLTNVLEL
jgi:hypothetical protein